MSTVCVCVCVCVAIGQSRYGRMVAPGPGSFGCIFRSSPKYVTMGTMAGSPRVGRNQKEKGLQADAKNARKTV
uniref:Putative secreted protein n=1 Tax=Anopheles darlingi TaxID=43151 RepID=A0A2M4DKW3_ANODA